MTDRARPNYSPGQEGMPSVEPLSKDEFSEMPGNNPHQAFLVGAFDRPGFGICLVEIEYSMYTPDTADNAKFELVITKFPKHLEMLYATAVFPIEDLEKVREVVKKHGFNMVQDSLPVVFDEKGKHVFPIKSGPNVFSVSGVHPDEGVRKELHRHWSDVVLKHEQGIPWKKT